MKSVPKKLPDGRWRIRIYPFSGSKACKQITTNTKGEAIQWANEQFNKYKCNTSIDNRTMLDLVTLWFESYGKYLSSGLDRKTQLERFCIHIRNPQWKNFSKSHFIEWRSEQTMTPNSINHWHTYLKSMFKQLKDLDLIKFDNNPMEGIRKLKFQETELSWLNKNQIKSLLAVTDTELSLMVRVGLSTGLRWGELANLNSSQIYGQILLVQGKTKNSKNRQIALNFELANELKIYLTINKRFKDRYKAFKFALARANIELPKGQLTHVLRHTFASHFIQNGGDILTLQKLLGHSDVKTTMRYAHLSQDHLNQVLNFNPLTNI